MMKKMLMDMFKGKNRTWPPGLIFTYAVYMFAILATTFFVYIRLAIVRNWPH